MTSTRDLLAAAIEARNAAATTLAAAADAASRGASLLSAAEAQAATFNTLDARIGATHARQIACGAPLDIPPELMAESECRRAIAEHVAALRQAVATLDRERAAAEAARAAADQHVTALAADILSAEAAALADDLAATNARRHFLRTELQAIGRLYITGAGTQARLIPLPPSAFTALDDPDPWTTVVSPNGVCAAATAHWRDYFEHLKQDATAQRQ